MHVPIAPVASRTVLEACTRSRDEQLGRSLECHRMSPPCLQPAASSIEAIKQSILTAVFQARLGLCNEGHGTRPKSLIVDMPDGCLLGVSGLPLEQSAPVCLDQSSADAHALTMPVFG